MSGKLGYGYLSENEAINKYGLKVDQYRKIKSKLDQVKKKYNFFSGGKEDKTDHLKAAIQFGWRKDRANNPKDHSLGTLGDGGASAAGIAAAMPTITAIVKILSEIDWKHMFDPNKKPTVQTQPINNQMAIDPNCMLINQPVQSTAGNSKAYLLGGLILAGAAASYYFITNQKQTGSSKPKSKSNV